MSDGALLEVNGVGKRFGGFIALADIELAVQQGERVGLVGPNGSGKSTLVNCICGTLRNESRQRAVRRPEAGRQWRRTNARGSAWRAASSCRGRSPR